MFLSKEERTETIWACRFCPMCHVADRVGHVMRRESYTPRGRGAILAGLDHGLLEWDETVADIMYTTLNDGLLQEWCVGNYDHEELIVDARARLFRKGLAPDEVLGFVQNLRNERRSGDEPAEILKQGGVEITPGADILLFSGCSSRQAPGPLAAMGRLFNRAGVPFQVLSEEPCCGWSVYQLGDFEAARELSAAVAKALQGSGASTIAVLEADCYRMLLTRTSRFGGDLSGLKVVHVTNLLSEWLETGKIEVMNPISESVTYHDPCALARYCDETEAPRMILRHILQRDLLDMETNGKQANCCGAGGVLEVHRPELSNRIARLRIEEAEATGASILATGCVRCDTTFLRAIDAEGGGLEVKNIVELTAAACFPST